MDSEAGEDLSWFWRGWFYNNWQLDLAVTAIKPFPDKAPFKGSLVTVQSLDKMVHARRPPGDLRRRQEPRYPPARGDLDPAGVDQRAGGRHSPVVKAVLDPDHKLPDEDRKNNEVAGAVGHLFT